MSQRQPLPIAGLHLAALSALALAQPLFELLGKNPDFLAAHGVTGLGVVLLGLVLVLLPPAALLAVEAVARLADRRVEEALHLLFVTALVGLIALQALKKATSLDGAALIAVSAAVGALAAAAYARAGAVRSFLSVLSPVPLVFLVLFLFFSPVSDLTLASGSAATANVHSRVPVVMVLFDEVSTTALEDAHGRIDPRLYPSFASLARGGTWYRYATAPTDNTTTAVPALLTGSLPNRHAVPILSDYPHNLFTLLGRRYRMKVSQEASDLCPKGLCEDTSGGGAGAKESALASDLGLIYLHVIAPHSLERDLPSVSNTIGNFGGNDQAARTTAGTGHRGKSTVLRELGGGRPARFEDFVRAIDRTTRPTLYLKHSLLPHVPFQYLPSGRRYLQQAHEPIPGLSEEPSWSNPYLLAQAYQRHLLQAGFADRLLGTVLDRLRREGVYDRALVLVSADNGESFLHRGNRHVATPGNVEDIADTPLFIKYPGQRRGRVVDRHVRTIDIVPTIADALGIHAPWRMDGRSLLDRSARIPSTVEVLQRNGHRLALSFPAFKRRTHAALERKVRLFGSDGRPPGLYGWGPHRELIGRSLRELRVAPGRGAKARLDDAGSFRSVDLRSDFVPALVTGTLSGGGAVADVAVAVNGRVAAIGEAFALAGVGGRHFSVLVPERAFRQGRNRVQVLAVSGPRNAPALTALGGAG